jgi:hypothetical protein
MQEESQPMQHIAYLQDTAMGLVPCITDEFIVIIMGY